MGKLAGIPAAFYYIFLFLHLGWADERMFCIETILFLEIETGTFNKKAIMRYGYAIWN